MKREQIRVRETIATIITEEEFIPPAIKFVKEARDQIQEYIKEDPEFKTSFSPVPVSRNAPQLINKMADAACVADVGPMASVAGTISHYVVEELVAAGAEHVIFDNGGDISMYLETPAIIGIYAGTSAVADLGFRISQFGEILGLCTSSGTVGHSFSYGESDAATIYAKNTTLADALATKLGNLIISRDPDLLRSSLTEVISDDVIGAMAIIGHAFGTWGHLPEIVRVNVDYDLISKAVEVRF